MYHLLIVAINIVTTFQTLIISYSIPPRDLISALPPNAYDLLALTHPEYMGSLPARKIPQWQPPPPLQPPNQQQRQMYQTPRPTPNVTPQQHRLLPGQSQGYRLGQSLTPMPARPNTYTPLGGGYQGQGMYNSAPPLGTYRGVGRPRKYDVRR